MRNVVRVAVNDCRRDLCHDAGDMLLSVRTGIGGLCAVNAPHDDVEELTASPVQRTDRTVQKAPLERVSARAPASRALCGPCRPRPEDGCVWAYTCSMTMYTASLSAYTS